MGPIAASLRTCVALALVVAAAASCSSNKPTKPAPAAAAVNAIAPSANARIAQQATFGDPAKWTSIYQMGAPEAAGCGFRGQVDGYTVSGWLGTAGAVQWSTRLPFSLREVLTLPASSPVPSGVLVAGKHDTDGDGLSEYGYAWVLDASGHLLDTELYSTDSSDVWVNGVAALSDSSFVLVGGERTAIRANPMVAVVALTATGQLEKRSFAVLTDLDNRLFTSVACESWTGAPGTIKLFVASAVDVGTVDEIRLHRLSLTLPATATPSVEWSTTIAAAGPSCSVNDLRLDGDRLYVCGGTDDATKSRPAGAGYWRSGIAARLTLEGDVVWSKVARPTGRSEDFDVAVPTPAGVFFVGDGVRYVIRDTGEMFGYGWVAKLATASGDVQADYTFGADSYASGFNAAHYEGGHLHCGGWTANENDGGPYRGWYCDIDVTTPIPALAPAAVGRDASAEHIGPPAQHVDRER